MRPFLASEGLSVRMASERDESRLLTYFRQGSPGGTPVTDGLVPDGYEPMEAIFPCLPFSWA